MENRRTGGCLYFIVLETAEVKKYLDTLEDKLNNWF